jgi:putative tricarboxylic transport membrane protein
MRLGDGILGTAFAALGVAVGIHVRSFPEIPGHFYGPGLFPGLIAIGLLVCGAALVVRGVRSKQGAAFALDPGVWRANPRNALSGVFVLVAILVFAFFGETIGFQIPTFATLAGFYLWLGRGPVRAFAVALGLTIALDLLFRVLLRVPVPTGVLSNLW